MDLFRGAPDQFVDVFFERFRLRNRDEPAFDRDQTAFTPFRQQSVYRLPANADQRPELPLGQLEIDLDAALDWLAIGVREPQQCLSQSSGLKQEHRIFKLLAGLAQPLAENLDQFHACLRVTGEQWHEVTAIQYKKLARHHRDRIRRSIHPVQQGDLAEYLTFIDNIQNHLAVVG